MAKTIIEQMIDLLGNDADTLAKVKAIIAANPKLAGQDKFLADLGEAYSGYGGTESDPAAAATTTTTTTVAATATHTPTTPATATVAAAAPVTTTATTDSASREVLTMLSGLKATIDGLGTKFVSKDDLPKLGNELVNSAITRALVQTNELSIIRETHREEFGEKFDSAAFEKFVSEAKDETTGRNKYPTLTAAYDAMVADKRFKNKVDKEVADQLKQKRSGTEAAAQSSATAMSAAQQLIAKNKAAATGEGKTNLQKAIDALAARDAANQGATVN